MNVHGLIKLSLLDYPGKLCATIFTGGCNFRCPFCHNGDIVLGDKLSSAKIQWEEVLEFLSKRTKVLDGVCISGGEPTLQANLKSRIQEVKALGFLVKLDTNGTRPAIIKNLIEANLLDYVAVDIKNSKEKYALTTGMDILDIAQLDETIDYLLNCDIDYEFRTTVVKEFHQIDDFLHISEWLQGAKKYYLQQFVDSEHVIQSNLQAYSSEEMEAIKGIVQRLIPTVEIRGI